ncbi:MAG: 1-phosphofructokinase [Tissierellales bacterium]|jgi:1-phosphofructokinase|nr:1-phosphofructokinase [Tissierellales bacterium]
MIKTLTLNPAIDETISIENFRLDEVNRIKQSRKDAAGKGINVSKVIKALGSKSIAMGLLGGDSGEWIHKELKKMNIESDFVKTSGETRVNIKIVDPQNKTFTDLNAKGAFISEEETNLVLRKFTENISEGDIAVLAGSLPQNVPDNVYQNIIEKLSKIGVKTILDASGSSFEKGLEAGPSLIKPNVEELEMLLDIKINTKEEVAIAARKLIEEYDIEYIVVSDGGNGSYFITKSESVWAKGIKVDVKSTVGAGDSMVAALALSLERRDNLENMAKWAAATSTANVMTEGTQTGDLHTIEKLYSQIEIELI